MFAIIKPFNFMFAIQIVIFLTIAVIILFGAHWIVYYSLIDFFSITNPVYKNILAGIIIFLAISFFAASFLARWNDNFLTRDYYFFSGFWLGLLANLVLATTAAWLIIGTGQLFGSGLSKSFLGSILILAALGYSIYGTWNAFNPRVKNITVAIPNLPEQWRGKKVVQISDVHLGHVHRESFARDIVSKANEQNPNLVVITGDLFDGMDGDLDLLAKPLANLSAEKGVYYVTGNHETYLGVEKALAAIKNTNIKYLNDEVINADGLNLIGINYPARGENKNAVAVLENLKKDYLGKPNIFLYHSPVDIDQLKNMGINLELCGHAHKGQLFPFNFVSRAVYRGYDYGLFKIGDYTLYTTSGAGTWGPPMRTGNRPEIAVITLQ